MSGYHIREAGATALQELAFTLRDGIEYVQWGVDAGLDVDEFVPRISFFFNAHSDFFEEIAKYRAARKIWARVMRERFGAKDERSLKLRFHTQTAGVSLTAQQPYNNVVRTALQALVGRARRHELAAHEFARRGAVAADRRSRDARAPHAADHRARERRHERRRSARRVVFRRAADAGYGGRDVPLLRASSIGWAAWSPAIEQGFPQREIAESAYRFQQAVEAEEKLIVGVNVYVDEDEAPVPILYIDEPAAETQLGRSDEVRKSRDQARVDRALAALRDAARGVENTMPSARVRAGLRHGRRNV